MPAGTRTSTRVIPRLSGDIVLLRPPKYCHSVVPGVPAAPRAGSEPPDRLSIVSWNLLAPCWKRTGKRTRESDTRDAWIARMTSQIASLRAAAADVLFLQEWWHANEEFRAAWVEFARQEGLVLFSSPRTRDQPDGVATLVRVHLAGGAEVRTYGFNDWGERVAQFIRLPTTGVVLCNTHLTFPHKNEWDPQMRYHQARKLSAMLNSEVHDYETLLLAGDLNGERGDSAVELLFRNANLTAHADKTGWVSHVDHNGSRVGCDFLAVRAGRFVADTVRLLGSLDAEEPESDHLMVVAEVRVGDARAHL
eukprot:TRINITY_DN7117_c0_g2_i1.p1 TRINITY_DN7117_c0_g2~~TRINITY_DN7117_c0_g2_i1.p1  ORF type:complete len:307 (+),score=47.60 TRINITY_DN7117_c0_g2_i1:57-977(+)